MTSDPGVGSVKFICWNIKGIQHPIKRTRVFTHLKALGSDIMYLQETHLRDTEHSKLKTNWIEQIFHSKFDGRSRGAAILIRKGVPFTPTKVIPDKNGRFIIVAGKLYGNLVLLANLYGPNWDNPQFFSQLIEKLPDLDTHILLMGGDFNLALHPIDKSNPKTNKVLSKSSATMLSFMESYRLFDPWRHSNPTSKMYSYFSPVHLSFSRIDFFVIDHRALPFVKRSQYHPIVISDHCPVQLDMAFPNCPRYQRTWQLDILLLRKKSFRDFVSTQIDLFLELNSTPGMSHVTIWESLKAYLRGQIISYATHKKKEQARRLSELSQQIADTDVKLARNPTPDLNKERLLLQTEFDNLSIKQTERLLLKTKQTYYEHGEKAGRLLCHQLKQVAANSAIPEIRLTQDATSTHPQIINDKFKAYYTELYTSQHQVDESEIEAFLEGLQLPKVDERDKAMLDSSISEGEIIETIKSMQTGKAPGPDGFPTEFYKLFFPKLAPLLRLVFSEIITEEMLPSTMAQATITVLLKKDKDPLECGSYRPISLLCCDYKILTKILSRRLETVAPKIIHPDQTGFVPDRQSFYNMRRLFNVLYSPGSKVAPEVALSLDAEKAFDRVEWGYLFKVLEKYEFGPSFIKWIKILYASPTASVRTNLLRSDYFTLFRGTRQGCSLSPFLFDLAIEPLAVALRQQETITGITRGQLSHKVSLYADDLLLYISDPLTSIPELISLLKHFGKLSGYKLNFSKSLLFPINDLASSLDYGEFPFKLERHSFTYLGIKVTQSYKELYDFNFKELLERTKADFQRWSLLPITLAGRVNTVKMTVLPRFLYLFQMIPILLTKTWFKKLDSHITAFIWANSTPRIKRSSLEMPKTEGGMGLPNFLFYYWAANVSKLTYWLSRHETGRGPHWTEMELNSELTLPLVSVLSCPLPCGFNLQRMNPVAKHSIKIWFQFRRHFGFNDAGTHLPLVNNHLFPPSQNDAAFKLWHRFGLVYFDNLFIDDSFASFTMLQQDNNIPKTHFFRYLQVRSFAQKYFPFPSPPPKNAAHAILELGPRRKKIISTIYIMIQNIKPPSFDNTKLKWEEDLGTTILDETWTNCLRRIHATSLCMRHSLIQFKVTHRLHYSNEKLGRIYPGFEAGCPRCHYKPATLGHMFWSCGSLARFWGGIFEAISHVCDRTIDPCPIIAIFGVSSPDEQICGHTANAVAFMTLLARRLILRQWKSEKPPSIKQWIKEVLSMIPLEKLRYSHRTTKHAKEKFIRTWSPFIEFVENSSST